jgi:Uncharacterised protein family (UPF0137)
MGKVNNLLTQRLKIKEKSKKMTAMATQSSAGNRSGFSGIFSLIELSQREKDLLENMLKEYATEEANISDDLHSIISITSEVKAINNQAAILHGERIKKAHAILTCYRDGAFSAWLIAAYGNRQTPYNFMQYYDFYHAMPKTLRPQVEAMPRQAIYTLATRIGPVEKKQEIIENYKGETKNELLMMIRSLFPLNTIDKRRQKIGEGVILNLKRLCDVLALKPISITREQKNTIYDLLAHVNHLVSQCSNVEK